MVLSSDVRIRHSAFDWLARQVEAHGDVLPWALLLQGFAFEGTRVPLVSQQGIFKPALMELPLSIRTSANGPYADAFGADGLLRYAYRGTDLDHRENRGLRELRARRLPLIYFHGLVPGQYLASWPAFVVEDDRAHLMFRIALEDARALEWTDTGISARYDLAGEHGDERRRYITRELRVRLHQRSFRERVLRAYHERCAFCRLRHRELLDAAHIVPDADPEGEPRVPNGLALCKLHHAAFDRMFVGIRPDLVIEVRRDILDEEDGPMLVHGLKGLHHERVVIPRRSDLRPDRELLEQRYSVFREEAGTF